MSTSMIQTNAQPGFSFMQKFQECLIQSHKPFAAR
jgi:hypothetical protein